MRDSDKKLQWYLWQTQGFIRNDILTYEDFMKIGILSTETIRRTRQKVQEDHPELQSSPGVRSMKEKKRKTKGTFVYREPIHYEFKDGVAIER